VCGRYTVTRPGDIVEETLDALGAGDWEAARGAEVRELVARPRFNAAPSEVLPIVLPGRPEGAASGATSPAVAAAVWGFPVPGGKRGPQINARSETAAALPTFAESFAGRRCLVPADGFYEWRARQPYRFVLEGGGGFCFAGLWTGSVERPAFCILTTSANPRVAEVHDRMPVILRGGELGQWLDGEATRGELEAVCRPLAGDSIAAYPVGTRVNRAGIDEPGLVARVEPPPENLSLF
jgi:putative SOS response-associated peptidase YedK